MKEVKIGFIGCGGNASGHMNQLTGNRRGTCRGCM